LLSGSGHSVYFFFQAENGIRDIHVTGVQTCALPIAFGPAARADLLAVEEHGRVVLLALADHHATLEVDRAEERAHRVDRGTVGGFLRPSTDERNRADGRRLRGAHQLQCEVSVGAEGTEIGCEAHHAVSLTTRLVEIGDFSGFRHEGNWVLYRNSRTVIRRPDTAEKKQHPRG